MRLSGQGLGRSLTLVAVLRDRLESANTEHCGMTLKRGLGYGLKGEGRELLATSQTGSCLTSGGYVVKEVSKV